MTMVKCANCGEKFEITSNKAVKQIEAHQKKCKHNSQICERIVGALLGSLIECENAEQ